MVCGSMPVATEAAVEDEAAETTGSVHDTNPSNDNASAQFGFL